MVKARMRLVFLIALGAMPLAPAFAKAPLNAVANGVIAARSIIRTFAVGRVRNDAISSSRFRTLPYRFDANDGTHHTSRGAVAQSNVPLVQWAEVPMLVARATSTAPISKYERFKKWFYSRPSVKALFSLYRTEGYQHFPTPRKSDEFLASDSDRQWNGWNGPGGSELSVTGLQSPNEPASGESISAFYDPTVHAAVVYSGTQGPIDLYVLRVASPPGDLPHRSIGIIRTARGLELGMSLQQIERIEGHGAQRKDCVRICV